MDQIMSENTILINSWENYIAEKKLPNEQQIKIKMLTEAKLEVAFSLCSIVKGLNFDDARIYMEKFQRYFSLQQGLSANLALIPIDLTKNFWMITKNKKNILGYKKHIEEEIQQLKASLEQINLLKGLK